MNVVRSKSILIASLFLTLSSFADMKSSSYTYVDGSGNIYKISIDSIEYIPVKKENSSTGMYSGGEPAKKVLSKSEYQKIQSAIEEIFSNKSIHIKERIKTSGMITMVQGKREKSVIFKSTEEKNSFEKMLKELLSS